MDLSFNSLKNRIPQICDAELFHTFSIFMPLYEQDGETYVLFETRSPKLITQPGEVCFPGGAIENGETPREAAVRETCEELLVQKSQINIRFPLDIIMTASSGIIYPFVGILTGYRQTFSLDEVASVFSVPLQFFYETKPRIEMVQLNVEMQQTFPTELIPDGANYNWGKGRYYVHFYQYENKIIWGLTAKAISNFVALTQKRDLL